MTEQATNTGGVEASDAEGGSPPIWLAPLGASLLVGGGGLILIDGLPVGVSILDNSSARQTAVIVGAFLLGAFFVMRYGWRVREGRLLGGGVLVVAALLLAVMHFEEPKIPDVSGLTDESAEKILNQLDIHVRGAESVASDRPRGEVVGQDPAPGSRSDDVVLKVSEGRPVPTLLDVIGLDQADARRLLASIEVSVQTVVVVGSLAGQVVGMIPAPPAQSFTVLLTIAGGGVLPTMSDQVGNEVSNAVTFLSGAGIGSIIEEQEAEQAAGVVIAQEPAPGEATTTAVLVVSAGPGLPVIPDVVNEQVDVAIQGLEDLNIMVTTAEEPSDEATVGTVIGQQPVAGVRQDSISLVVSSGPRPTSFVGDWSNVDADTNGLTRLIISGGTDTNVQGFGACTPDDCDWGKTAASLDDTVLVGTFDFSFKTTQLRIERAGPLLLVEAITDYSGDDQRQDRTDTYVLAQQEGIDISLPELEVIAASPILEGLVIAGAIDHIPVLVEVLPPFAPAEN